MFLSLFQIQYGVLISYCHVLLSHWRPSFYCSHGPTNSPWTLLMCMWQLHNFFTSVSIQKSFTAHFIPVCCASYFVAGAIDKILPLGTKALFLDKLKKKVKNIHKRKHQNTSTFAQTYYGNLYFIFGTQWFWSWWLHNIKKKTLCDNWSRKN